MITPKSIIICAKSVNIVFSWLCQSHIYAVGAKLLSFHSIFNVVEAATVHRTVGYRAHYSRGPLRQQDREWFLLRSIKEVEEGENPAFHVIHLASRIAVSTAVAAEPLKGRHGEGV